MTMNIEYDLCHVDCSSDHMMVLALGKTYLEELMKHAVLLLYRVEQSK